MAVHSEGDWLVAWDAEDPKLWDKSLAWKTLVITTFNMTFCFVAWFLPSAMVPKLNGLGFGFSKTQLYWLASIPGLSGGIMRLVWMVLPPILGTRKMVTSTMALIFVPMVGWGIAIQDNSTPFWDFSLASAADVSPASCLRPRISFPSACKEPRWVSRPASETSEFRWCSC